MRLAGGRAGDLLRAGCRGLVRLTRGKLQQQRESSEPHLRFFLAGVGVCASGKMFIKTRLARSTLDQYRLGRTPEVQHGLVMLRTLAPHGEAHPADLRHEVFNFD